MFGRSKGENEHGERQPLKCHTGLHQPVAVFFVEFATLDHRNDTDNQNAQNGGHGKKHTDCKNITHVQQVNTDRAACP